MKIVAAYYTHKPGGFCKRLYRLLGALAEQGHSVFYLSLDKPPADFPSNVGWEQIPFPMKRRSGVMFWAAFVLLCPLLLFAASRRISPERIVAFNPFYSAMWALPGLIQKIPIILFVRSLVFKIEEVKDTHPLLRWISNVIELLGVRLASRVVCMTLSMKAELLSFASMKEGSIAILPNDVPQLPDKFVRRDSEGDWRIVTSGVLDQRKNVGVLLNAISALPGNLTNVSLRIVGDGPLINSLKDAALRITNGARIQFPGWVPSLYPEYESASLVVHPSLHEGMPNSVLEALAAGIPVIASDTPESREFLLYDELLFDPRSAESLASKLRLFMQSAEHRLFISHLCQKRAVVYSFDWNTRAAELVCS